MLDRDALLEKLPLLEYALTGDFIDMLVFAPHDYDSTGYEVVVFDLSRGGVPAEDFRRIMNDAGVSNDAIDRVLN